MGTVRPYGVQYVSVTASTTATGKEVVAAVSGSRTRILGVTITSSALGEVTLQSSTGGVYLGPIMTGAGIPAVLPPTPLGYGETAQSRGVYAQLTNAVSTAICLQYSTFGTSA